MPSEVQVSAPLNPRLSALEPWKSCVWLQEIKGERVEMVTKEFHDEFVAEMRLRVEREVRRLRAVEEALHG